jgi:hypothetical protein
MADKTLTFLILLVIVLSAFVCPIL